MKLPVASLVVAYAIFFGCLAATAHVLPAQMASHFKAKGDADGWMSRSAYFQFISAAALSLPLLMTVGTVLVGLSDGRSINLPHRDHWLSPAQRAGTIKSVQRYMIGFCPLFVLFITGLHVLVVVANAGDKPPRLNADALSGLALFFFFTTGVWLLLLWRRFAKVD